jgi:trans-aconitate methyltransferase
MSTTPKPAGWAPEYAQAFHDEAVARVYRLRPPYPDDLFSTLTGLIVDQPRTVLDLGCGPGDLARRLGTPVKRKRLTARPALCSSAWFRSAASRWRATDWSFWSGPAWSGALRRRPDHRRAA